MRRTTLAVLAVLALLGGACGDDDEGATTTTSDDGRDAELVTCENPVDGYAIDHPADWETNPAEVMEPCSLFDPDPIDVEPGTEVPLDVAVRVDVEPVDYERASAADQVGEEVLAHDEPAVGDLTATRIEARATSDAVQRPVGTVSTRWIVDLGDGRSLLAVTTESPGEAYEAQRAVLDAMVGTLELTGA